MANGGAVPGLFPNYNDAVGFQTDGSGTPIFVNAGGKDYFLTQTTDGNGTGSSSAPQGVCQPPLHWSNGTCSAQTNLPGPTGRRLTWIQKR
jgi:hypothetical protein